MSKRHDIKVAVISSIPFSLSNRGDDILTLALQKMGCRVTHITCASRFYLSKYKNYQRNSNLEQLKISLGAFGYSDRIMGYLPSFIGEAAIEYSIKNIAHNFNKYDLIVVGSGKPVFLHPLFPDSAVVVYRQSDPMSIMMCGKCAHRAECKLIKRADGIICVRMPPGGLPLYGCGDEKATIIENGFNLSSIRDEFCNTSYKGTRPSAVYVGYTPIDAKLLEYLAINMPHVDFRIIGDCISSPLIKYRLSKIKNIKLYGNLTAEEYLPIVASSCVGIVPYAKKQYLQYIGMNSKYIMYMKMRLPIVSVDIGCKAEFPISDRIHFVDSYEAFLNCMQSELERDTSNCFYDIDFNYYSVDGRISAYIQYFTKVIDQFNI